MRLKFIMLHSVFCAYHKTLSALTLLLNFTILGRESVSFLNKPFFRGGGVGVRGVGGLEGVDTCSEPLDKGLDTMSLGTISG